MNPLGTSLLQKPTATDELLEQLDHFRARGEFSVAKMCGLDRRLALSGRRRFVASFNFTNQMDAKFSD